MTEFVPTHRVICTTHHTLRRGDEVRHTGTLTGGGGGDLSYYRRSWDDPEFALDDSEVEPITKDNAMPEFVPTHRVRDGADIHLPRIPDGTPLMRTHEGHNHSTFVLSSGGLTVLNHDYVEPIPKENPVTELIPDKRYRWTVEGTAVDYNSSEYGLKTDDNRLLHGSILLCGVLELLLDPLPETVDSVVMVTRDNPAVRGHERHRMVFKSMGGGRWYQTGSTAGWSTKNIQDEIGGPLNGVVTVLFDAGADR